MGLFTTPLYDVFCIVYFLMNEIHVVCNLILNAIYMQIVANYCESLTLDSRIKRWMSEVAAVSRRVTQPALHLHQPWFQ